jgi:prolipoprotein diacylglyceryltransferase
MNGIVISLDRVSFHLGAFGLRWYSLATIMSIWEVNHCVDK